MPSHHCIGQLYTIGLFLGTFWAWFGNVYCCLVSPSIPYILSKTIIINKDADQSERWLDWSSPLLFAYNKIRFSLQELKSLPWGP